MSYQVRCECGKSKTVSAADAGADVTCGCGRSIEVPPLHQLRAAAGEVSLSPAVRIPVLLREGKLPGTRDCVCCHRETDRQLRVYVECERMETIAEEEAVAPSPNGCLLGVFGIPAWPRRGGETHSTSRGQDISFTLRLPVCEACDEQVGSASQVRSALRHISEYAALLDRYPDARVTRLTPRP